MRIEFSGHTIPNSKFAIQGWRSALRNERRLSLARPELILIT